jgi:hypothetical protein
MNLKKKLTIYSVVAITTGAALAYPVTTPAPTLIPQQSELTNKFKALEDFSSTPPSRPINLIFLHHSVGSHLLAESGEEEKSNNNLQMSHPNGGGLRQLLEANNYQVNEATYGSLIGKDTDLFDWLPKFRNNMNTVLNTKQQDTLLDNAKNEIVMFKSCFPNSRFKPDTNPPSSTRSTLTLSNAKATMIELKKIFEQHPNTLFIYVTAPPQRAKVTKEPLLKWLAKAVLNSRNGSDEQIYESNQARDFNNWLKSSDGWLKDYPHNNIVVFDYFDLLTNNGKSNFLQYASNGGTDNHPSTAGQKLAAIEFIQFINQAVRYAGIQK